MVSAPPGRDSAAVLDVCRAVVPPRPAIRHRVRVFRRDRSTRSRFAINKPMARWRTRWMLRDRWQDAPSSGCSPQSTASPSIPSCSISSLIPLVFRHHREGEQRLSDPTTMPGSPRCSRLGPPASSSTRGPCPSRMFRTSHARCRTPLRSSRIRSSASATTGTVPQA